MKGVMAFEETIGGDWDQGRPRKKHTRDADKAGIK
jgi:hypothetical protein